MKNGNYINNKIDDDNVLFAFGLKHENEVCKMPMLTLAFIGDAVHALFIKEYFALSKDYKQKDLQILVSKVVRAKNQARALNVVLPELNGDALDIVRRAKNAKTNNIPKNASVSEYHESTAYEALVGYYYLTGKASELKRLLNLTKINKKEDGKND